MELSRREQEILAQLEEELTQGDGRATVGDVEPPTRGFSRSPTVRTWLVLMGLLGLGLVAVILLSVLLLDRGPLAVGILTGAVVVPWFILAFVRLGDGKSGG